ncbi:unnamed protein product [Clonostachys solani]|uniref:Cytochrome P450 n=1 Tax=Clonostachys solani TaxID=160281 RepID=A0A9N9YSK3_9HYPO|nr:unnamed protein product [Clonostachys solani]
MATLEDMDVCAKATLIQARGPQAGSIETAGSPFPGHAIALFKNTTALYQYADAYFEHNRQPYALQVAGQQLVVVSHPRHKTDVFKNTEAYSFDPFINIVYTRVGNVSEDSLVTLWRKVSDGFVSLHPNPRRNVLVKTGQELLHKQVQNPDYFKQLAASVNKNMEDRMRWNTFAPAAVINEMPQSSTKVVSMHRWVREVTIGAQTRSFFGPLLEDILPNFTEIYDLWDINSWMATYQYPDFMAKAATRPREQLVDAIMKFLDTPKEKRTGGVPYVSEVEDEMRHAGLDTEACARVLMIILWGIVSSELPLYLESQWLQSEADHSIARINSNVQMTTFWMMVHIVHDPALMAAIRAEIAPTMTAVDESKEEASETLRAGLVQGSPLLNSVFNEIIRFYNTGSSMRETTRETNISGKRIPAGTKIVLPQRQLLLDTGAFGQNANIVDCYRFFRNKELERHEFYRPFGQGITLCSGKKIGRFESLSFVAWALWRFDIKEVRAGQRASDGTAGLVVPRLDLQKPSLGISKQVEGDDMVLEVSSRPDVQISRWAK